MAVCRIPDDDARIMRAEYEAPGKPSLDQMADRWGWSANAIRRAILRVGGKMRVQGHKPRFVLPVPDRMVLSLAEFGMRRDQIAARFAVTPVVIDRVLKRARRAERRA